VKLRLYLDTSVVSAYVDDRSPERRRATIEFWDRLVEFEVSVSELTVAEVRATGEATLRRQMEELIQPFEVLAVGEESRRLSQEYVRRGVFSSATIEDALHVAIAVASRRDILVSWNFRHLVNRRRRMQINEVNVLLGHATIEILAPPEVEGS
jgi:predicted nucleic acid-binding protein